MTHPPQDAEAVAREAVKQALRWCSQCGEYTSVVHPEQGEAALTAYAVAIEARKDAEMNLLREALETVASIQERGPDTAIARVQQAYDMRCVARRALEAK